MAEPPQQLEGAQVIKFAVVSADVVPTGVTRHWFSGKAFGPAAALAIARYPTQAGTYLLYLDDAGDVVTDTWLRSLDHALRRAAFEYEGLSWIEVADRET